MKKIVLIFLGYFAIIPLPAQNISAFKNAFHIKIQPVELLYDYSRLGIGIEKKFNRQAIWASYHFGRDLTCAACKDDPTRYFTYDGIQLGMKWLFPDGVGEYYIGGKVVFDLSRKNYFREVYYDLDRRTAILYDAATYKRTRLGLFAETGYEIFLGPRFSIDIATGIGLLSIQNGYENVQNPFELEEVTPLNRRRKYQYKYVEQIWRPALTGALKFGWRL